VVYNHTAEGNHLGPTLSFKGIDNRSYYLLVPDNRRYYFDVTGTGNSLKFAHPATMRMAMDSLRYWVQEMRVDGFRFDLATTLARDGGPFSEDASFLHAVMQDPLLSTVKLIAEPWDVGPDGYQLGNFPPGWSEWNGQYRDTVRRFWLGEQGIVPEFATRLLGSTDIFDRRGREPRASINFVTAHDGFTLRDLVSYNHKHNEANGEENRDGSTVRTAKSVGLTGKASTKQVRTQMEFVRRLLKLRHKHIVFHRDRFFYGKVIPGTDAKDVIWLHPSGREMTPADWQESDARSLAIRLSGEAGIVHLTQTGEQEPDDTFLLLVNAAHEDVVFVLPDEEVGVWYPLVDTVAEDGRPESDALPGGTDRHVSGRSLQLLRLATQAK
jgi:isoamylase